MHAAAALGFTMPHATMFAQSSLSVLRPTVACVRMQPTTSATVSSKKNMFAVRALSRTLLMLPSSRRVVSMDATVTMDQMGWNAVDVQQSDFALGRGLIYYELVHLMRVEV